jgi:hypothetical protein
MLTRKAYQEALMDLAEDGVGGRTEAGLLDHDADMRDENVRLRVVLESAVKFLRGREWRLEEYQGREVWVCDCCGIEFGTDVVPADRGHQHDCDLGDVLDACGQPSGISGTLGAAC